MLHECSEIGAELRSCLAGPRRLVSGTRRSQQCSSMLPGQRSTKPFGCLAQIMLCACTKLLNLCFKCASWSLCEMSPWSLLCTVCCLQEIVVFESASQLVWSLYLCHSICCSVCTEILYWLQWRVWNVAWLWWGPNKNWFNEPSSLYDKFACITWDDLSW